MVGAVVVLVAAVAFGCSDSGRQATLPAGGVASHLGYFDTPYGDPATAASAAKDLEVKILRDGIAPHQAPAYYARIHDAFRRVNAATGVTFLLGAGRADQSVTAQLDAFAPLVADGIVRGIEGANEWDNVAGQVDPRWAETLRAHQVELYRQVKERWPTMPVVGPSLSYKTGRLVGDLSAHLDIGNLHYYASVGNGIDRSDLDARIAEARLVSGTKPMWATEANGIMGDGYPDSDQDQAEIMRRLYRLLGERGIQRVFSYELLDGSRPRRPPTHRENNFGAFRIGGDGSLQAKPVFFEVRAANRRG